MHRGLALMHTRIRFVSAVTRHNLINTNLVSFDTGGGYLSPCPRLTLPCTVEGTQLLQK